jgi:tRNA(Ile)-lysidine synthase
VKSKKSIHFCEAIKGVKMLPDFLKFINHKLQLKANNKLLLAVSGGVDSMVMLHLFSQCNFELAIAHCNFKLRNDESDDDEKFVKEAVAKAGKVIHQISFDTTAFAKANKLSIQMAARTLRYNWFEQLTKENNYDYVAVAHHQTDILETLLINQIRGTGLSGMHGIKAQSGSVIRPLLFATRDEIYRYAVSNNLTWREDSSNAHDDYLRNKIRLQVLPVLKEINPSIEKTFAANAEHFGNAELLIESFLPQLIAQYSYREKDSFIVDLEKLKSYQQPKALLYYLLRDFNFKNNLIDELAAALQTPSHKVFHSVTHQLLKDRKQLIVQHLKNEPNTVDFTIEKEGDFITEGWKISFEKIPITDFDFNFKGIGAMVFLDAEAIQFPIQIRNWVSGDYFYPSGMKGKKLLSDYFTDAKISQFDRKHILLLLSDGKIACIVGKRADERFKVTSATQVVLKITYAVI